MISRVVSGINYFEVPAIFEADAVIESDTRQVVESSLAKESVTTEYLSIIEEVTTEPVGKADKLTVPAVKQITSISATYPFYFQREGASFEMLVTYRSKDEKFRFEDMRFKPPKQRVVYKDKTFAFESVCGLLTDARRDYAFYIQPVVVKISRFSIYPTVVIGNQFNISYGLGLGIRWGK